MRGTRASSSPLAGSSTAKVSPESASIQAPSTKPGTALAEHERLRLDDDHDQDTFSPGRPGRRARPRLGRRSAPCASSQRQATLERQPRPRGSPDRGRASRSRPARRERPRGAASTRCRAPRTTPPPRTRPARPSTSPPRAARPSSTAAPVAQAEELVRVAVLLVVVDQGPGTEARSWPRPGAAAGPPPPHVGVKHVGRSVRTAATRSVSPASPTGRQVRRWHWYGARTGLGAGKSRSKSVVSRAERAARDRITLAASSAGPEPLQRDLAVAQELPERAWRVPAAQPRARRVRAGAGLPRLLERRRQADSGDPVRRDLDAGEQAVERRDRRSRPRWRRTHFASTSVVRADEGVVDAHARREVPVEEHVDELRDELAEVRMQLVDVLRALGGGRAPTTRARDRASRTPPPATGPAPGECRSSRGARARNTVLLGRDERTRPAEPARLASIASFTRSSGNDSRRAAPARATRSSSRGEAAGGLAEPYTDPSAARGSRNSSGSTSRRPAGGMPTSTASPGARARRSPRGRPRRRRSRTRPPRRRPPGRSRSGAEGERRLGGRTTPPAPMTSTLTASTRAELRTAPTPVSAAHPSSAACCGTSCVSGSAADARASGERTDGRHPVDRRAVGGESRLAVEHRAAGHRGAELHARRPHAVGGARADPARRRPREHERGRPARRGGRPSRPPRRHPRPRARAPWARPTRP